ncbi:hypothetical protein [Dapis sp. BLCC M172]|uniref:hypothetical protein n=1 Tax=Dapis sp. BLCC M172 TaxID=2975281 RepID=UPI003CEF48BA
MGKQFSLTFNVKDDDSIDTDSIKFKLGSPPKKEQKSPPGRDFTIILSMIVLGIIFIVNFLIPASVESISEEPPEPESEPKPTNSQNNSTAKSSNNYEPVRMYFEEY